MVGGAATTGAGGVGARGLEAVPVSGASLKAEFDFAAASDAAGAADSSLLLLHAASAIAANSEAKRTDCFKIESFIGQSNNSIVPQYRADARDGTAMISLPRWHLSAAAPQCARPFTNAAYMRSVNKIGHRIEAHGHGHLCCGRGHPQRTSAQIDVVHDQRHGGQRGPYDLRCHRHDARRR